ncbi:SDR family oxidoreductase [Neorhizobium sp. JUb45]|uniref:SDR family oxidoreductase n=1 Tax=unclassified Neorhizobium TaxID=2629175 RepID=UPI001047CB80|nr:SDR family oxidoreductase [Neorhizobium sp. JUb45]TCR00493.1 uncharacterized protein YbjT (DUF2867 family) [Neorhizobium sp. JUb45]
MTGTPLKILSVGATGSIGRLVVPEALSAGHSVRALVRDTRKGRALGDNVELVLGDLSESESLKAAVDGVAAIIFTHGSDGMGKLGAEHVDYGGVQNILSAVGSRQVAIALMTAIGVTNRTGSYNQTTEAHDWKRRAERLVRASGLPYTIIRPGWFDYNDPDQHRLVFLQGDERQSCTPADGVISRMQIAQVLVGSVTDTSAHWKTFELVAEHGPAQESLTPLFSDIDRDRPGSLDAVRDVDNMPLSEEPARVMSDLDAVRARKASA